MEEDGGRGHWPKNTDDPRELRKPRKKLLPPEHPREASPTNVLSSETDFGLLTFRTVREHIYMCEATKFVVIHYSGNRK